jgi:hypothetical protein
MQICYRKEAHRSPVFKVRNRRKWLCATFDGMPRGLADAVPQNIDADQKHA